MLKNSIFSNICGDLKASFDSSLTSCGTRYKSAYCCPHRWMEVLLH